MAARTLYVNRPLLNGEDLIAWAKGQGFPTAMLPADLHTTIAYSREPFDWSGLEPARGQVLAPMGGRSVQQFGKATVLGFESPELHGRWQLLRAAGASWDFPSYQPHVTFTYDPGDVPLDQVQPYRGPLLFGPEEFAEIDDSWSSNLQEKNRPATLLGFGTMTDLIISSLEVKSVGGAESGEFEGYASVFGNVDSHGDVVVPGAFAPGLAALEASGRKVAMHLNHGLPQLGGRRGIGKWTHLSEDTRGLHVKGKIAGMDTETGRYTYAGVRDGAYSGLSIGFRVRPGGALLGTKAAAVVSGANRALKDVGIEEISIVDTPSNAQSLVLQVKAQGMLLDPDRARAGVRALLSLEEAMPEANRDEFKSHLQELQAALGLPPDFGVKSAPATKRECEDALRDAGFTRAQALRLTAVAFDESPAPRDAGGDQVSEPESKSFSAAEFLAILG